MTDERYLALSIAIIGHRTPPRQTQPVFAAQFEGIRQDVLDALVADGLLEHISGSFSSSDDVYDMYRITPQGVEVYEALSDSD